MKENILLILSNDKPIGHLNAAGGSVQVTVLDEEYYNELNELTRALRMNPLPFHSNNQVQFLRPGHSDYYLALIARLATLSWKGCKISGSIVKKPNDCT
jgi:hypothetical protein